MKTLSEWLNVHIDKKELGNRSFGSISHSAIAGYRNSRVMPKLSRYKSICKVLNLKCRVEDYRKYKKNFVRNTER